MNIFILSLITKLCAEYHADKHVVKLIIELAQLLCSAHIVLDQVTEIEDIEKSSSPKNLTEPFWNRSFCPLA